MAALCVTILINLYQDNNKINEYFGSKDTLLSVVEKYKNSAYSPAQIQELLESAQEKRLNEDKLSRDEKFVIDYILY